MRVSMLVIGVFAASLLSGCTSDGSSERAPYFGQNSKGGCQADYEKYKAASGHAAYAATSSSPFVKYFICGSTTGGPSREAAERRALESCKEGLDRYKVTTIGGCEIVASK